MLTIEEIIERLKDRNVKVISSRTGISYHTILNIQKGKNVNPTLATIKKLTSYFEENK